MKIGKTAAIIAMLGMATAGLPEDTFAQSGKFNFKKKAPAKNSKSSSATKSDASADKLDIQGLEQKYWAPKDTDFSVVQNRTYTKEKKYAASVQYGLLMNDGYSSGGGIMLTGNYFMDERQGVEVTYQTFDLEDSDQTKAFLDLATNTNKLVPDHGKLTEYYGVGYTWVPFYAKVSMLGKKILYLDIAVTPHIGMSTYEQLTDTNSDEVREIRKKQSFTYGFDITQMLFISKELAFRFDVRNRFFSEDVLNYRDGTKKRTKTTNTTLIGFGLTYFF